MVTEHTTSSFCDNPPYSIENVPVILQTPQVFYRDLLSSISSAEKDIYLRTMLYLPGQRHVDHITDGLVNAAQRGVPTTLEVDAFSDTYFGEKGNDFAWIGNPKSYPLVNSLLLRNQDDLRKLSQLTKTKLKDALVQWITSNKLSGLKRFVPFTNTDHVKLFIIDQTAWGLAGAGNICEAMFSESVVDFISKTQHPTLVQALREIFPQINQRRPTHDQILSPIPNYQLLHDSGKRGRSIILEKAAELIEGETEGITFSSQFLPDGKIFDIMLSKVTKGTPVTIYTHERNHQMFSQFPFSYLYQEILRKIYKTEINLKFAAPGHMMHAKAILCSGQRATIIGSHNFVSSGVKLGTQELSLLSQDLPLFHQVEAFFQKIPTENI